MGKRLLRLESEIIMKILNNLRWKHYVITAILVIAIILLMLVLVKPMGSGSECFDKEPVTTTTTVITSTTSTNTTAVSMSKTTISKTTSTTTVTDTKITDKEVVTKSTTAPVVNEPVQVTEESSTEQNVIEEESNNTPEPVREYTVYKPATHYIHKNTCRWCDNSCYEISNTEGLECLYCTECNPDMEIVTAYVAPVTVVSTGSVSDYDRRLLAEIVQHEAGSNWISQYNKAKVVAGVMNRVNDSRFPSTVYAVLTSPNQFTGYWPGCNTPSQACYDAVDYYFSHTNEFNGDNSWWGDGYQNHFYTI